MTPSRIPPSRAARTTSRGAHRRPARPALLIPCLLGLVAVLAAVASGGSALAALTARPAAQATSSYATLFAATAAPKSTTRWADTNSVELGVRFRPSAAGSLAGLRFYRAGGDTSAHIGTVWDASGHVLGQVAFPAQKQSGWQSALLAKPVALTAGSGYAASYHSTSGYAYQPDYFSTTAAVRGPLTVEPSTAARGNGVYTYAAASAFPTHSYRASNYWIDVLYTPAVAAAPPASTSAAPSTSSRASSSASSSTSSSASTSASTSASSSVSTSTSTSAKPSSTTGTSSSSGRPSTSTAGSATSTSTASSTSAAPGTSSASTSSAPAPSGSYPARWSVGAPGVAPYAQSDPSLPVPAGYTVVDPSDSSSKEYDLYSCSGTTTIDHKYFRAFLYIGTGCHGTINITNSIIAPPAGSANRAILVNSDSSGSLTLNISNSTIRPEPVGLGGKNAALNDHAINDCATCTIHLNRVDVANTGGMCECGQRTLVEYSWLHDNYIANLSDPSLAHTGGVFPYGGSGPLEISHSRLEPGVNAATGQPVPNYWQAITAVLFTQSSDGSLLRNYSVHDNFISLGAFDMDLEDGSGLSVTNNVFGPNHWGSAVAKSNVTFAAWSGNVVGDIDGNPTTAAVPRP